MISFEHYIPSQHISVKPRYDKLYNICKLQGNCGNNMELVWLDVNQ